MTLTNTLSRLLAAARLGDQSLLATCAQEYIHALAHLSPLQEKEMLALLANWQKENHVPVGRCLGRFLYRGKPATAYDADGLEGLVLDHHSDGQYSLRVTNPPVPSPDGRPYIDAVWLHDDVAIRIEPGTYPALYHLDEGGWTLDHSPEAVPALATPLV